MHKADEAPGRGYGRDIQRLCGGQRLPPAGHFPAQEDAHPPFGEQNQACDGVRPGVCESRHTHRRGRPRLREIRPCGHACRGLHRAPAGAHHRGRRDGPGARGFRA